MCRQSDIQHRDHPVVGRRRRHSDAVALGGRDAHLHSLRSSGEEDFMSRQCTSCKAYIFTEEETCSDCAAGRVEIQDVETRCIVCRKPILPGARRCNECDTYQNWPNLPMITIFASLIGGILAGILGVASAVAPAWFYISDYRSNTQFKVSNANADVIFIKVWNT